MFSPLSPQDERYAKYLSSMADVEREASSFANAHTANMETLRARLAAEEVSWREIDKLVDLYRTAKNIYNRERERGRVTEVVVKKKPDSSHPIILSPSHIFF